MECNSIFTYLLKLRIKYNYKLFLQELRRSKKMFFFLPNLFEINVCYSLDNSMYIERNRDKAKRRTYINVSFQIYKSIS